MAKFQYFSDIHLEFYENIKIRFEITPSAPYLIIAGDIGCVFNPKYRQFLTHMSEIFTYVFIVSGNHEYYYKKGKYYSDTDQWMTFVETQIREICHQLTNVIYLQNELFVIPNSDICVYGTTLWSDIDDQSRFIIRQSIADYRCIPNFTTDKSANLFKRSIQLLTDALGDNSDKRFVVVSHHLPSYQLISEKYRGFLCNSAFASSVQIANHEQIVAWVAGHTHCPVEMDKFHVNPIGYPDENQNVNFNKTLTVIQSIDDRHLHQKTLEN